MLISLALFSPSLRGEEAVTNSPKSDIVIVGAGISGLCTGLEAARAGARVTLIDMASVFGGHAVMSSGMVCLVGTPEQQAAARSRACGNDLQRQNSTLGGPSR